MVWDDLLSFLCQLVEPRACITVVEDMAICVKSVFSIHTEVSYLVCSQCFLESLLNCLEKDTRVGVSMEMESDNSLG